MLGRGSEPRFGWGIIWFIAEEGGGAAGWTDWIGAGCWVWLTIGLNACCCERSAWSALTSTFDKSRPLSEGTDDDDGTDGNEGC